MSDVPVSAPAPTSAPSSEPSSSASPPESSAPEAKSSPPSESPQAEARRLKLKVDGNEEDYDLSNEDNLRRDLQKARAADKRMAEAAKLQKQYDAYKADPKAFLRDPANGFNARELAEQIMLEELEAELEDPRDREQRLLKERLKKYEEAEAKARENEESEAKQAQVHQARQHWDNVIGTALESSDLPKTPETIARIARSLRQAMATGYKPEISDVIAEVKASYEQEFSSLYGQASLEKLMKFNPQLIEQLRQHDLKSLKSKPAPSQALPRDDKGRFQPNKGSEAPKTMNEYDFAEYMKGKFKGG